MNEEIKKRKRVALAYKKDPANRQSWSGTTFGVYSSLLNKGYDVKWVAPTGIFSRLVLLLAKVWGRLFALLFRQGSAVERWSVFAKIEASMFKINDEDFDVVITFGVSWCAYLRTSLPIISVIDATYNCFNGYYVKKDFPLFAKFAERTELLSLKRANLIIGASDWVKKSVVSHYGIPERKVVVRLLGANIDFARKDEIGFPRASEELRLLFIGFDFRRKGLQVAIDTVKLLREKYRRSAILNIIGVNKEEVPLSGDCGYLKFIGRLNKNFPEQMALFQKIISEAHLFILPTRAECAGMVFSEAAAYGLPIFSYSTGGVPSYVEDMGNGRLLPLNSTSNDFAEEIIKAWDGGKFPEFSARGIKNYEKKLNWELWESYWDEIFNKL